MSGQRQKTRQAIALAFTTEGRGETPDADREGTEHPWRSENPKARQSERLMEAVCERDNLKWRGSVSVRTKGALASMG